MRVLPALLLLLLVPAAGAAPPQLPKADAAVIALVNDAGRTAAAQERLRPLLAALLEAKDDAARAAARTRIVQEVGASAIEVLVRYRDGALVPVFLELTAHEAWYVRRLAVFALQRTFGFAGLDRLVALLDDGNPLVREIAATTIAVLHHQAEKERKLLPRDAAIRDAWKGTKGRRKDDARALEARRGREEDAFVRAALTAAIEVLGRRDLLRIHEEPTVDAAPGRWVPRLEGAEVNAYQQGSGVSSSGSGRLAPTTGWGYPVLLYPHEVLSTTSDAPLVPLPGKRGSFHYGHDCGWFLDGSGVYAVADGVVRWVRSGGDWGGLVVTEHEAEDGERVCALNGHCGTWVFVKGGEKVVKGQLLAQMGLSFSAENGGHGAHDHFGLFRGPFAEAHCYGRGMQDRTADGWLVPADFLTPRVDGERIAPDSYR